MSVTYIVEHTEMDRAIYEPSFIAGFRPLQYEMCCASDLFDIHNPVFAVVSDSNQSWILTCSNAILRPCRTYEG